ncbi:MAG: hypothetical protein KKB02_10015 [Alphaproteobacteria bacterium]|nr:hypothetical protein [Alphaproteobacteria bacterium]
MTTGLLLPALALGLLGWLVPKLWSMLLPDGFGALALNAVLSALTVTALTALYFVVAYWQAGMTLDRLLEEGAAGLMIYFGRLGLSAAIIWAPMMGLSLVGLWRSWVRTPWEGGR